MENEMTKDEMIKVDEEGLEEFRRIFFPEPKKYHLVAVILDIFLYAVIIKVLLRIWMWI